MASIVSPLAGKMFSAEFSRLQCSCDSEAMSFSVIWNDTVILSQSYFPDHNGIVFIYDLDKLFESYISELYDTFTLCVDDSPVLQISVFLCRTAISEPAMSFCSDFFFSHSMGERDTAMGRFETLSLFCDDVTSVDAVCSYLAPDGSVVSKTKHVASLSGWAPLDVSPAKFADNAGSLFSYVVQAGARKARYRVLLNPPEYDPAFIFRNSFGCWETIYLSGSKQVTPSYTRSNAIIEGQNIMYDILETMSFKAYTGPLRPGMVPVALDLARSREIYLLGKDGTPGDRVNVSEVDVKHTNEDNEIPDFAFTYRRADRKSARLDVIRPPKIFDSSFDSTYE